MAFGKKEKTSEGTGEVMTPVVGDTISSEELEDVRERRNFIPKIAPADSKAAHSRIYSNQRINVYADGKEFRWETERAGKSKGTFKTDKEAALDAQRAIDKALQPPEEK
jgi:hypothetical protein